MWEIANGIRRRTLLSTVATGIVGGSSAAGIVASSRDSSDERALYDSLSEKYGQREAEIIVKSVDDDTDPEDLLTDPRLENARRDYLEHKYATVEGAPDVNPAVIDAASRETLRAVKRASKEQMADAPTTYDHDELETPCYERPYTYSLDKQSTGVSPQSDHDIEWNSFYYRHVTESSYGGGGTEYSSDCRYQMATKMRAQANSALYGGGEVTIRHLMGQLGDDTDLSGTQTIVGEFDVSGVAPSGEAELSIVRLSDRTDAFQTESIKRISSSIDDTVRGQAEFDLNSGDLLGAELHVSSDGTGGAGTTDFYTRDPWTGPQDRGAAPTLEVYL